MKKPPTYEQCAALLDNTLVTLAASDAKLSQEFEAHLLAYDVGIEGLTNKFRNLGIGAGDLDCIRLLPAASNLIFGPADDTDVFDLHQIEKLGFLEQQRLAHFGVKAGCRSRRRSFQRNGSVRVHHPLLWRAESQTWVPVREDLYQAHGRKTLFDWRKGEWREYAVRTSSVESLPDLASVVEWSQRCCWSIRFAMPSSPGIIASTDPTGVKELLRMRDVPEGRSRREALLHWVKEHWRQNRKDESVEHQVRAHFRGSRECDWFGLWCRIGASREDEARLELEKLKGKVWRKKLWREEAAL